MSEIIPVSGSVQLERIHDILDSGALRAAVRLLDSLAPAEIAHVLESLPSTQREILWGLIREDCDGAVLLSVTDEVRAELTRDMSITAWLAASDDLDPDDLAELVRKMPDAVTRQVINALDEQHRKRLETVLAYPEDTAGGQWRNRRARRCLQDRRPGADQQGTFPGRHPLRGRFLQEAGEHPHQDRDTDLHHSADFG